MRRTSASGSARRSRVSASSASELRACPAAAGKPIAASSERMVSMPTTCRWPLRSHHSGAMPAASARRAKALSSLPAPACPDRAGCSVRTTTLRGGMSTSALSKAGGSPSTAAGSPVSTARFQPRPGSGSGKRTMVAPRPAFKTTATRSSDVAPGSASTITSTRLSGSFQSPSCIGAPSGRSHVTSGGAPCATGKPVRKRSAISAGCALRSAISRAANAIKPSSARDQSSQAVALSCA